MRYGQMGVCWLLGVVAMLWQEGVAQGVREEAWGNPFDFPVRLSGNFGELRGNHFHTGLDIKTDSEEGKAVRAVRSGYVSRVAVSPWGYGRALYVNHSDGMTSVYGHLQRYASPLGDSVAAWQYARESFALDTILAPDWFVVRQGDTIAWSGNSGSSGGPHLHFEIRRTESEACLNPLAMYQSQVHDSRPPRIHGFLLTPLAGRGVVNGSGRKRKWQVGGAALTGWGEIGVALKTFDYMDGEENIYGVYEMEMYVDGERVFRSCIDSLSFENARYVNSYMDYAEWKAHHSFYTNAFVEPGNRLPFIESVGRGILRIDEERPYRLSFLLRDRHGNETRAAFTIDGQQQEIAPQDTAGEYFHWKDSNRFGAKGIRLFIPAGNLYDNLYFRYACDSTTLSPERIHTLHEGTTPLHDKAYLSLRLQCDSLEDKRKYGIARLEGETVVWLGGIYRDGWLNADIRDFGQYTLMTDTQPPSITPLQSAEWTRQRRIAFLIRDTLSGIHNYRGEIDGQYALFEYDAKNHLATFAFDTNRFARGKHRLLFSVTDACGNTALYGRTLLW